MIGKYSTKLNIKKEETGNFLIICSETSIYAPFTSKTTSKEQLRISEAPKPQPGHAGFVEDILVITDIY